MRRMMIALGALVLVLSGIGILLALPDNSAGPIGQRQAIPNLTPTLTPLPEVYLPAVFNPAPVSTFAVIGDYGLDGPPEAAVAAQVTRWQPTAIFTLGDNNYPSGEASTIDQNIGKHYHQFIAPYGGSYGTGAITNAFFPALGNHDWVAADAAPYLNYFTLPNNERYYSVRFDDLEVFVIDSDPHEPDGIGATSIQAQWLEAALGQSEACWKIVTMHHAPYSSASHGSNPTLQWPYAAWGADAVFAGHDHVYERLDIAGVPYIVNGLGGTPALYSFGTPLPESVVRYNAKHGAQRIMVLPNQLRLEFINVDGILVDSFEVNKTCS